MVDYETTPRLPRINIEYGTPDRGDTAYSSFDAFKSGTNAIGLSKGLKSGSEVIVVSGDSRTDSLLRSQVIILDSSSTKSSSTSSKNGFKEKQVSIHSSKCSRHRSECSDDKPNSGFTLPSKYSSASQKASSKSARSSDRKLSFDVLPTAQSAKSSSRTIKSLTDRSATMSPYRLELVESDLNSNQPTRQPSPETERPWRAPRITKSRYNEMKTRLLEEGKFKHRLKDYFRLDTNWWEEAEDSEDDGYDTDLDKQLGFELIADEKSREILQDGAYPEYKRDCRKFRSNPNSYFLRHCLEDDLHMRHRYLTKGDSITISNQIKNHLTTTNIDLTDNGIGPRGMKYFKHVLRTNKHLTELNLASNNLGAMGAKYLRSSVASNCFLQKLDVSDNDFGERGGKYISGLVEDNVNLKDLNISRNSIGDVGIGLISKALGRNISLKILDISWNHISPKGAVQIAESLKKNSELEALIATMNGFGEEGGKAIILALRQNPVLHVLDLSFNRITDPVIKLLTSSLDTVGLKAIRVAYNQISTKIAIDLLTGLMAVTSPIAFVDFEGIHVTDELKGLANAIHIVHNIDVLYSEPPSKREVTQDVLTRNLVTLCEFMEDEEMEVDDLFPDYDELEGTMEGQSMITVKEVICALELTGSFSRQDKLRRLAAKVAKGKNRKFQIGELALVYDQVICGKDPLREMPLRTHLRRSINEERAEKERKALLKTKKKYPSLLAGAKKS